MARRRKSLAERQRERLADPHMWLGAAERARKELAWLATPRRFWSWPRCRIAVGLLNLTVRMRRQRRGELGRGLADR
jgi:hypothetical protein